MKHKVGDTVRIKSKAWIDAQPKDGTGFDVKGNDGTPLTFVDDMFIYAGQSFQITDIYTDSNYELGDMADWEWSDAMLEDDSDIAQMQKRIDRLEAEVLQLKGKAQHIVYDQTKHYVGIWQDHPYILKSTTDSNYNFHGMERTATRLTNSASTGQGAIDIAIKNTSSFDDIDPVSIYVFDTGKEALEFMLKYLQD